MKAIVAVDLNWGIGFEGSLLQRIPEDMRLFKEKTLGKVVVMGRETFESLPGREPLKDRTNIILSKSASFQNKNLEVVSSIEELLKKISKFSTEDVFVIGGESIYRQLLPYCSEAYVTKINNSYKADKYFENIDIEDNWKIVYTSQVKEHNGIEYRFLTYVNDSVKEK